MPPSVYLQNKIAVIWDFDKTLTHDYMQEPLFRHFKVDAGKFWGEVNSLAAYYADKNLPGGPCEVSSDTIYLNHILTYVNDGTFGGLTNVMLRELGGEIELAPGLPDFFRRSREAVSLDEKFAKHDICLEHYIVSTGLRQMILGSPLESDIDGVWACDLLPSPPPQGANPVVPGTTSAVLAQLGYTIDNTSKTRAIFEINKGVNVGPTVQVNDSIPEDQRRVPIRNMIYVADGPSDIPSFSVVNAHGGGTLGVYAPGPKNYENAAMLQEQGRVNSIALADYSPGSAADMWLLRKIRQIANEIADRRERVLASYSGSPTHVV